MKAQILKSTASTKGGFVNTLSVVGIKKDPILGDLSVNDRFYFKSPTENQPRDIEGFNLANYIVTVFKSDVTNEETGEVTTITSKWLTPAN
jgi:hypothetical protein